MNSSATGYGGPSLGGDPRRFGISHTSTDNSSTTNNVHGNSNTNFANVSNIYNNTINMGTNEESLRIQAWLSPLEPGRRHRDVRNRRLDGVGDWVLQTNEFESWCKSRDGSDGRSLRCYGGQGVGKTYISSLVIDTLCKWARGQNIVVLSLYCDYQEQKNQSAVNMVGSLLRQIAVGATGAAEAVKSAFRESGQADGQGLRLLDMLELFAGIINLIARVYICVDAVDELLPQDRSEFLRALRQIIQDAPNTRLFLTGRPHIRGEINSHLTEGAYKYSINITANQGDIARYLSRKIDDDKARDPHLMTEDLRNDIVGTMLKKASEMFLLVALNIDAILGETTLARRRKMLLKMDTTGVDLDNVYDQTLQRIREQKGGRSRLGMEVLMWVSHSQRPLQIDELRHALAVELGSTELDPENIPPQDTVLGSCLGLAVVDAETSIVRLIHYTLQEYLSQPGVLPDAHKTLGERCLTYLNCDEVKELPVDNVLDLWDLPFLEYASFYWGVHAKIELSDHAKSLALELLNQYNKHISATLLLQRRCFDYVPGTNHLFSGLHCASYFGIYEVATAFIETKGWDINQGDCEGYTPLIWAIQEGNNELARFLLAHDDIDPDKPDNYGQTQLWHASWGGNEEIVKILLARDSVNPDRLDASGGTPLWWASANGCEEVVRLLLARDDVNPDYIGFCNETPLEAARSCCKWEVVEILEEAIISRAKLK